MLVEQIMTQNPITIRPDSDYLAAIAIMRAGKFRHLPVINDEGELVGIVSKSSLDTIQPTNVPKEQAIHTDGVLVRVAQVMKSEVITVPPDYPLEEAASLMLQRRISSLPVCDGDKLVGIITDSDIFQVLVQMLGGGSITHRIMVEIDNRPGQLAELSRRIAAIGGNILTIASCKASNDTRMCVTMRIENAPLNMLISSIENHPQAIISNSWSGEESTG